LIKRDLAPLVSAPIVYRFERIPSAMTAEQIKTLLSATRSDRTPNGLRDYGILLLFATYGLRAGEVVRMRLDDINWRQDKIQVKQSKGGAELSLPLTPEVGEAILRYLRRGRSETDRREIFLRARVPHGPFSCGSSLYSVVQRRLRKAGIEIQGKSGPHTIRYARAISLLRATVRLKTIGDVLGHRSAAATEVYLKLATDDLRSVALELPNGAA
jgi:integrase